MINLNTIVHNLDFIVRELRKMNVTEYCHVEAFSTDQIMFEDKILVKLMNEIISELRIDPELTSEYDFLKLPFQQLAGNEIPEDKLDELYSEFYKIVAPRFDELHKKYAEKLLKE